MIAKSTSLGLLALLSWHAGFVGNCGENLGNGPKNKEVGVKLNGSEGNNEEGHPSFCLGVLFLFFVLCL